MVTRFPPSVPAADAALARLAETGDPAALGALFDATAKDLFRAAVALTGNASAAEDALQETYLAALTAARRFRRGHSATAWLVGILRHKAAHARQRALRDRVHGGGPDRACETDGLARAGRDEDARRVHRAIEGMREPYRSVALLRWRYGLSPAQIAHVRDVPPGTVWSLLGRALARLRRSLAGLPAAFLGQPARRGLAALRRSLVAQASGSAATELGTVAVAAAGGALMATKATLVAVGVACALLGIGGATVLRPAPAPPVADLPARAVAASADPRDDAPVPVPAGLQARSDAVHRAPDAASDEPTAPSGAPPGDPPPAREAAGQDPEGILRRVEDEMVRLAKARLIARAGKSASGREDPASPQPRKTSRMTSAEDLTDRLDLDARSRAYVESVVEETVRELVALRRTPDERGRTWEQAQADTIKMLHASRVLDDTEIEGWRERRIPGGRDGETFGARERRIVEDGRTRLRDAVPPAQREAFDALLVIPMFGPFPPGTGGPTARPPSQAPLK